MNTFATFSGKGSGTPLPKFGRIGATTPTGTPRAAASTQAAPSGLPAWLATEEARRLAGRWVLLTDDFKVIDSCETPRELLDSHPEDRTPFIVYVDPGDRQMAV